MSLKQLRPDGPIFLLHGVRHCVSVHIHSHCRFYEWLTLQTRMHSSRMRTARSSSCWGEFNFPLGCRPGSDPPQFPPLGVGLDLIPLNFQLGCGPGPDPPQFPPWLWTWTWSPSISPFGLGLEAPPGPDPPSRHPPLWTEWQTGAKIWPCRKLRLRAVNISSGSMWHAHFIYLFFGRWPWWKWSCVSWSGGWTSSFGNCRNLFFYTLLPAVSSTKLCNWYIFIQTWFYSFCFIFILLYNFNQMKIKPIENFFRKPISMISSASLSNLKKKQQQRAWTIFCCSVRRTRGIGKPEMPPLPSSDEGIEVVINPGDRTSREGNHWCSDKSTNPWVSDLSLNHVTNEGTLHHQNL